MFRFALFLLACAFLLPARGVSLYEFLEPEPPDNSLWLEYSSGLEDSSNLYGELDLALAGEHHLLLGAGKSDVKALQRRVNLYSLLLGYHSAYGEPFEFSLLYDFWGNTDELWSNALSLPLRWNSPDWSLALQPQFMRIQLYSRQRLNRNRRLYESDSRSLSVDLDYYGLARWQFGLSAASYDYDVDLTRLDNPLARQLFSDVTLILSYGFPDSRLAARITRHFDNWRLGLKQERSISAVDYSHMDITSLSATFYPGDRLSLLLEGGHIRLQTGDPYNYLKLGTQLFF